MYEDLFYGCGINYPHCKEDCYWYREEQDMCAHIPYCQSKGGNYIEPEDCENCEHYHSKYEKTNADRIRVMDDEELAEYIHRILENINDNPETCPSITFLKQWLSQEAN